MIVTLTLNPAIDKTISVDELHVNKVNRVKKVIRDAGGKGINVSKVIHSLGEKSIATGILAGINGTFITNYLQELEIRNHFLLVDGETRENTKIFVEKDSQIIEINEVGPECTKKDMLDVIALLDDVLQRGDLLILAGSVPIGVDVNIYNELIDFFKEKGVYTLLDATNQLLKEGLKAKPDVIKPNIHELNSLVDFDVTTEEEIIDVSKEIVANGIKEVIVTLGEEGALSISEEGVYKVKGIPVDSKSTVGAGDSFVGGLAYSYQHGFNVEKRLKFASAVATASVLTEGTKPGKKEEIELFYNQIEVKKLL